MLSNNAVQRDDLSGTRSAERWAGLSSLKINIDYLNNFII